MGKQQFRKVTRYIWRDPRFRKAGTDAELLFLYLWTGPQSSTTGITACTAASLAVEHGWTVERANAAIAALADAGLAEVDESAGLIAIDQLDLDPPDNGRVVRHWAVVLGDLPQSPVIAHALEKLRAHCVTRGGTDFVEGYQAMLSQLPPRHTQHDTVSDTVSNTVSGGYQLQRQIQRQIQRPPTDLRTRARARGGDPEPISEILSRAVGEVAS